MWWRFGRAAGRFGRRFGACEKGRGASVAAQNGWVLIPSGFASLTHLPLLRGRLVAYPLFPLRVKRNASDRLRAFPYAGEGAEQREADEGRGAKNDTFAVG